MQSAHSVKVTVVIKQHQVVGDEVVTTGFMNSGIDYDNWTRDEVVQAEALTVEFLGKLVQMAKDIADAKPGGGKDKVKWSTDS